MTCIFYPSKYSSKEAKIKNGLSNIFSDFGCVSLHFGIGIFISICLVISSQSPRPLQISRVTSFDPLELKITSVGF